MKITSKRATELAREGIYIRKQAIIKAKPCKVGIYMDDNKFYICNSEFYNILKDRNEVVCIKLIDVRYQDTIKDMADHIKSLVNHRNRM